MKRYGMQILLLTRWKTSKQKVEKKVKKKKKVVGELN